ncbi:MAG: 16S rRNA (guanine(527)-N(7))-methyltransferase RsmG [Holosporales bacterium]|nr:16S rRNA (guanine(527)-N(7))-methyltransferase RsmG [Holosporales bacterium]
MKHLSMYAASERAALDKYVSILLKWGQKINLICTSSSQEIYTRHILDSAQIAGLLHKDSLVADIGTGAGLPGIVLSVLGFGDMILCEKSLKKCVFLAEVKSVIGLNFKIYNGDVWNLDVSRETCNVAMVSRAFGKVRELLMLMTKTGIMTGVFHKGASYREELESARKSFSFDCEISDSITRSGCVILKITNVRSLL